MPDVLETEVHEALLRFSGEDSVRIGEAKVEICLTPLDVHTVGRPDGILWLDASLRIFEQDLRLRIPIPIEAEKNGIPSAMEDLEGFVDRGEYAMEIPMLVVSEAGYGERDEQRMFPVKFRLTQIPLRRIKK